MGDNARPELSDTAKQSDQYDVIKETGNGSTTSMETELIEAMFGPQKSFFLSSEDAGE